MINPRMYKQFLLFNRSFFLISIIVLTNLIVWGIFEE